MALNNVICMETVGSETPTVKEMAVRRPIKITGAPKHKTASMIVLRFLSSWEKKVCRPEETCSSCLTRQKADNGTASVKPIRILVARKTYLDVVKKNFLDYSLISHHTKSFISTLSAQAIALTPRIIFITVIHAMREMMATLRDYSNGVNQKPDTATRTLTRMWDGREDKRNGTRRKETIGNSRCFILSRSVESELVG